MAKQLFRLLVVVALAMVVSACGGGNGITGPTPPTGGGNGGGCQTGIEVEATIEYRKKLGSVSQDPVDIGVALFNQGNLVMEIAKKLDDLTHQIKRMVKENTTTGERHRTSARDAGLWPDPSMTATDIYVNGVLLTAKGPAPGGVGEAGYFRINGCGVATSPPN